MATYQHQIPIWSLLVDVRFEHPVQNIIPDKRREVIALLITPPKTNKQTTTPQKQQQQTNSRGLQFHCFQPTIEFPEVSFRGFFLEEELDSPNFVQVGHHASQLDKRVDCFWSGPESKQQPLDTITWTAKREREVNIHSLQEVSLQHLHSLLYALHAPLRFLCTKGEESSHTPHPTPHPFSHCSWGKSPPWRA